MKPIDFKGSNTVLTAPDGMDNCEALHTVTDGRTCLSCWQLSLTDRIRLIFGKPIWMYVLSGKTQPPICLETDFPAFLEVKKKQEPKTE